MTRLFLALVALVALTAPVAAQTPSAELSGGAQKIVALLRGEATPAQTFTPAFLAEVPNAQVRAIVGQLASQYGAARALGRLQAASPQAGTMDVDYERATVHMNLTVDPQPPHLVSGLLITSADVRGDSLNAVIEEIRALAGEKSIAIARLGDGTPAMLSTLDQDRPLAIGSAFKLFILAELSRQVRASERHWSDVVTLDRRSIPSGMLQGWPRGAPVTLHTLASLMISISDNTAADLLLHLLGRENVERMMVTIGVQSAARNRPMLSTLEMAAIKTGPATGLNAWLQADEAGRRRMLANDYANVDAANIDLARFAGNPLHIDGVEWFASASDMVRVMDWLRRNGDDTARAILTINPGLGPAQRGGFAYVGYKGGSEPGVLNLTWLIRSRAGAWHVVTGGWNNVAAPVDEGRFIALMARAVQLLRD